nr:glycosyltransferase [Rhodothermaceae bacterium]
VIFEPNAGGHHGLFIQHLLTYWGEEQLNGVIDLIVTQQFLDTHQQIATLQSRYSNADIRVSIIDPLPSIKGGSIRGLVKHDLRQGGLLKRKLSEIRPTHALLMYFDHLQLSMGTTLRFIDDIHLAGIYFRPSFHYPIHKNSSAPSPGALQQLRKKLQLKLAMKNPHLQTLFSLDPYVVPTLNTMSRHTNAVVLPDGVERPANTQSAVDWQIDGHRLVAFCFGSLAERKGVFKLLDALPHVAKAFQQRLALVFAGAVSEKEKHRFYSKVEQMRTGTDVQIVVDDRFVDDAEVQPMIRNADLILVAYQQHIGSSNVLIRAADAGLPVLGSNFGLVGAQIRDHSLGTATDTTNPIAIAAALEAQINQEGASDFDAEQARRFASNHDATLYAETIFSSLGFK